MVGHKGHPEVEGTAGRVPGGVKVIETVDLVNKFKFSKSDLLAYVTQTTLSVDDSK